MAVDNWEDILNQVTGWHMHKRDEITGIKGASGSAPWVEVTVKKRGDLADRDDFDLWQYGDVNRYHLEFFVEEGGIPHKYQVDLAYADLKAGAEYSKQAETVLAALLNEPHTSIVVGSQVPGAPTSAEGVDLKTFAATAMSFDRAADFFKAQIDVLRGWADRLGSEDAAWKGNAAGAFWHLIDDLHSKYEGYLTQLRPAGFSPSHTSPSTGAQSTTLHGNDLIGAEQALFQTYQDLWAAIRDFRWQQGSDIPLRQPDGGVTNGHVSADPRDVLAEVFDSICEWIGKYNAPQVLGSFHPDDGSLYAINFLPGFSHHMPQFGNLQDTSTWAAAAQEAVNRWTTNIQTNLDAPGQTTVNKLQQSWSRVMDPKWNTAFTFTDTSNTSLSKEVTAESADKTGNSLNDSLNKLNDGLGNGLKGMSNNLSNLSGGLNDGLKNLTGGLNNALTVPGGSSFTGGSSLTGPDGTSFTGPGGSSLTVPGGSSFTGGSSLTGPDGTSLLGPDGASPIPPAFSPAATGLPVTNLNGSSTTFGPGGTSTTTNPDGSVTTRNADGSLTTNFPDGSTRTVSPGGDVTTVDAQGHSTTSHLAPGKSLTNPDGTRITHNADGSLTQTGLDGSKTTTFPNGTTQTIGADGQTQITSADGIVSHLKPDGSLTTDFPGHGSTTVHPNGDVTTTDAAGHSTTRHLAAGQSITNPDGTTVSVDSKGDIITHNPDGSTSTLHPDGKMTTTQAPATGNLPGSNLTGNPYHLSYPTGDSSGLRSGPITTHLPGGGSITTHPNGTTHTTFSDGSSLVTSSDGNYQSLPSPASAAAAQGAAAAQSVGSAGSAPGAAAGLGAVSDSQNAMGLLSPMMMMAGMSRMGGQQQGGQGGGERNRDTYEDRDGGDAAFMHNGLPPQRDTPSREPEEYEEEESDSDELLGPRRTATESRYGNAGPARMSTQSSSSWAADEDDVWGTEDGGLPASIGH